MVKNTNIQEICIFCGKERTVHYWTEDGVDYMGHARGQKDGGCYDEGCDCELGKLEHKKVTVVPMCYNCKFYKYECCINKKKLDSFVELFDLGTEIRVKHPHLYCECHELSPLIFERLTGYSEN